MRKKKLMTKKDMVLVLAIVAGILALSFLVEASILYLIFWAFGWDFNLKIAFGIWLVSILINSAINSKK